MWIKILAYILLVGAIERTLRYSYLHMKTLMDYWKNRISVGFDEGTLWGISFVAALCWAGFFYLLSL